MGDLGAVAGTMTLPGLHNLIEIFDGKLETATYFCMDHPDLLEEYRRKTEFSLLSKLAAMLEAKPDYIEISCSGLLTLSTPEWVLQFSLPTLKKATHMCRQAGIPSELHACGKARLLVEMAANETELDSVNPLQPPPMGDCDLAEIKHTFGKRLCIKGNVGVTEPMLTGTPSDVEKDVIRCLDAAKAGGAYILFTEEGLGRDTPFDNIRKFVEVGKALGKY
jgi:uroporphyrinogen-III decarboxylase